MAKAQNDEGGLAGFASRMGDTITPPEAPTLPPDEVEPEPDVVPAQRIFDLDAYLDLSEKDKDKFADTLSEYANSKEGVEFSYQGGKFRLRRGVPASIAFSGTIKVGDQTELALLVRKQDREGFAEALADDDRFLLVGAEETAPKDGAVSPAVRYWVEARSVLQALALERGNPNG